MRESLGQIPGPRMQQYSWYSLNTHEHLSVSQPHLWLYWGNTSRFWMVRCRQIYYKQLKMLALKLIFQILQPSLDFPGHPVIKTLPSNAVGVGSIPGQGLLFKHILDFPGGCICLQCRRPGFSPWVGKISWRRKW